MRLANRLSRQIDFDEIALNKPKKIHPIVSDWGVWDTLTEVDQLMKGKGEWISYSWLIYKKQNGRGPLCAKRKLIKANGRY